MKALKDVPDSELERWLSSQGQPLFRKKQVREWMMQRLAVSFDEMVNLPRGLRASLSASFACCSLTVSARHESSDGTVKWLFRLLDGETIETVLIRTPSRQTVCISTQVGCQVRCVFCASGKKGLTRNLSPAEMIDQVVMACREAGERVSNIVVMGMGEPMHNLRNLEAALTVIGSPDGLGMGARHVTVSTSGVTQGIRQLGALRKPWNLAISLHAVRDEVRAKLIPARHREPIADILSAAESYREMTGRMVTLEYILIEGMNASEKDAEELASIAKRIHAKVNLIPSNTDDPRFSAPAASVCESFLSVLTSRRVQASLRLRKGKDIRAACGMLRSASSVDGAPASLS